MTSFLDVLKTCYEKHTSTIVSEFITQVSNKTKISQKELLDLWNNISPDYNVTLTVVNNTNNTNTDQQKTNKNNDDSSSSSSSSNSGICKYCSTRGDKKQCTSKISDKSITKEYCARHAKIKEKDLINQPGETSPKVSPKSSPKTGNKKNLTKESVSLKDEEKTDEEKIILYPKINKKLNIYVDQKTNFIIDKKTKKIYALLQNDKINPLDADSLEIIQSNGMDFDSQLIYQLHPDLKPKTSSVTVEDATDSDDN